MDDPRFRNVVFDTKETSDFLVEYGRVFAELLATIDDTKIDEFVREVQSLSKRGGQMFIVGNGGSAAMANHLACDFTKGTHAHGHSPVRAISLCANDAIYTAIANDFGLDNVFSKQLEFYGSPGDILLAISSSGNSQNILNSIETAKELNLKTIGFSGFDGGRLAGACDINFHVHIENYCLVEDVHMGIANVVCQLLAKQRDEIASV